MISNIVIRISNSSTSLLVGTYVESISMRMKNIHVQWIKALLRYLCMHVTELVDDYDLNSKL